MTVRSPLAICLGACLLIVLFVACPSGPSSSSADKTADAGATTALERKADFLDRLAGRRHAAARVLGEFASALPDRVRLTDIAFDAEGIRVEGNAPSNNLLADYVSRLEGSAVITGVYLRSSLQKAGPAGDYQEFVLQAREAKEGGGEPATSASPASRLAELEKLLPARQEQADLLREIQRLAAGSGLRMTGFAPGGEIAGEFCAERPVSIEVAGRLKGLADYLRGMAELPQLWVVERFSFKAVDPHDARSDVQASIAARTFFLR